METSNPSTIAGVFRDRSKADRATDQLKQAGFNEDQIKLAVYNLNTAQEAQGYSQHESESSRIVVTVQADGRDLEAVGILFDNGANNSDLPPGMVLEHGSIISSQPETVDLIAKQEVDSGFSGDSFFAEGKTPDLPGEPDV